MFLQKPFVNKYLQRSEFVPRNDGGAFFLNPENAKANLLTKGELSLRFLLGDVCCSMGLSLHLNHE
jgi:hypothetical protein